MSPYKLEMKFMRFDKIIDEPIYYVTVWDAQGVVMYNGETTKNVVIAYLT